jgi:hypothetical protein
MFGSPPPRIALFILGTSFPLVGSGLALPDPQASGDSPPSSAANDSDPGSPARKELLRLIGQFQVKLPRDLARKLIVISMKLATGYCSLYAAKELEEAIDAVPDRERKAFEKEWKMVREHKHWPRMPDRKDDGSPAGKPAAASASEKGPS